MRKETIIFITANYTYYLLITIWKGSSGHEKSLRHAKVSFPVPHNQPIHNHYTCRSSNELAI